MTWTGARCSAAAAVVFQDFIRYALSAGDNIALGRHERAADTAGIVRAAEQAGADGDISALPSGYETLLGPAFIDGTDLSTGQWQRLALARTFFRDAPLVILDEPTAALDAKAEHELFAKIGELFADRSVLLISHRFSTVRSADRIYVLSEGYVVEAGTHEELVARPGPTRSCSRCRRRRTSGETWRGRSRRSRAVCRTASASGSWVVFERSFMYCPRYAAAARVRA